jgi:hypothetical protein
MPILIGLALACVLLYFWIAGNGFARALAFIAFAVLFGIVIPACGAPGYHESMPIGLAWMFGGFAVAWFVSGIPLYCSRQVSRV